MATEVALPAAIYALGILITSCFAHENPHNSFPDISEKIPEPDPLHVNRLKDPSIVGDRGHIMEHYDGVMDKKESEMTDEEVQFHYFKVHDSDDNNLLDGLEIINAMTHFHTDHEGNDPEKMPKFSDTDFDEMIGKILDESDLDKDGYISYSEYVLTQKKNQ